MTATIQRAPAVAMVERYIEAVAAQDLGAILALFEDDALWEIHVPGWDAVRRGHAEMTERLLPWFIRRDGYTIAGYQLTGSGDTAALRWEQHWLDAEDGAPCICHQCHFFQVDPVTNRIRRQWMYCTGVMVYEADEPELELDIESAPVSA